MKRKISIILIISVLFSSLLFSPDEVSAATKKIKVILSESQDIAIEKNPSWLYTSDTRVGSNVSVSRICDLVEIDGGYTVIYPVDDKIYFRRMNPDLTVRDIISVKKRLDDLGGAICDADGNYYIAFGKNDYDEKGGIVTFEIAKYDHKGKYLASYQYIPNIVDTGAWEEYLNYAGGWATKGPFGGGNCVMAIHDGILVCYMGRMMYNGHQSSALYAVKTSDMTRTYGLFMYASHSFDQRIIVAGDGRFITVDQSDGDPRGFTLSDCNDHTFTPFNCTGDRQQTYANLAGIAEAKDGFVLIGSSVKGDDTAENKQLFMQVISKDLGWVISSGERRTVHYYDRTIYDNGVIWLTDDDEFSIEGCNMTPTGDDRFFIAYTKAKNNGAREYCCMIVDVSGKIILGETRLGSRINNSEELKYANGYVYWTTGTGDWRDGNLYENTITINRVNVNDYKLLTISYKDSVAYTGKTLKPKVTIKLGKTKMKSKKAYTVTYTNSEYAPSKYITEKGTIKIAGKGKLKDFHITLSFDIFLKTDN